MLTFPHCKINLGLQVLGKRSDGFHDIETVFYPVPLKDVLEILPAANNPSTRLFTYGLAVEGAYTDNLCYKAWELLKKNFASLPAADIHLLKNIPMGAGLGGGSSDGAFMLQMLNSLFALNIPDAQLAAYALQLGSDCPFFLVNQPCYATGRGEVLVPVSLDLSGYQLVLAHPGIHVSTAWAFAQLSGTHAGGNPAPLNSVLQQPPDSWKSQLYNDFEKPVFDTYPVLKRLKEQFYKAGAIYASMSGSGSTVFALFRPNSNFSAGLPPRCTVIGL